MSAITTRLQNLLPRPVEKLPATQSFRMAYALTGAILVTVALALAVYLMTAIVWQARPFFGAMLSPTQMVLSGGPVSTARWTGTR